jgi:hypothetical protein
MCKMRPVYVTQERGLQAQTQAPETTQDAVYAGSCLQPCLVHLRFNSAPCKVDSCLLVVQNTLCSCAHLIRGLRIGAIS